MTIGRSKLSATRCARLSYTSFKYSALAASKTAVTVQIENSGKVAGAEVVQLYLGFPASAGEPPKQLKGFSKIMLAPGAKQTVSIPLTAREISTWDVQTHGWKAEAGLFEVFVGSSSRDIRLTGSFTA